MLLCWLLLAGASASRGPSPELVDGLAVADHDVAAGVPVTTTM